MDNRQFMIAQGSTPIFELGLPFELPDGSKVNICIWQDRAVVLEFDSTGGNPSVDTSDKSVLRLELSQADTFALAVGDAELQVRVQTADGIDTFLPIPGVVIPSYNKEVWSDA